MLGAASHGPAGRRMILGRATHWLDGLPVRGTTVMVRLACKLRRASARSADLSLAERERKGETERKGEREGERGREGGGEGGWEGGREREI